MAEPATVVAVALMLAVAAAMTVVVERQLFEAMVFLPLLLFEVDFTKLLLTRYIWSDSVLSHCVFEVELRKTGGSKSVPKLPAMVCARCAPALIPFVICLHLRCYSCELKRQISAP